jgi:hypothetical protein
VVARLDCRLAQDGLLLRRETVPELLADEDDERGVGVTIERQVLLDS